MRNRDPQYPHHRPRTEAIELEIEAIKVRLSNLEHDKRTVSKTIAAVRAAFASLFPELNENIREQT